MSSGVGQRVEIWVRGTLGPAAREAFADFQVDVRSSCTVISGRLTQDQLHLILAKVRALALDLVEVRHVPEDAAPGSGSS